MKIDEILNEVGGFGVFQISLYCMLGLIGIPSGKIVDLIRRRTG